MVVKLTANFSTFKVDGTEILQNLTYAEEGAPKALINGNMQVLTKSTLNRLRFDGSFYVLKGMSLISTRSIQWYAKL